MNFFRTDIPILTRKKSAFDIADSPGLWRVHWQVNQWVVLSTFYTRHDQACMLWGVISAGVFTIAQFVQVNWLMQSTLASVLTVVGMLGMAYLTWHFSKIESLMPVLYAWMSLMLIGILLTDIGVFAGKSGILIRICPLWLGLSALGYLITGLTMRSRMFMLVGFLHLAAIWLVPYVGTWQPLFTGFVISGSVFLIAELQWDANGFCEHPQPQHSPSITEAMPEG